MFPSLSGKSSIRTKQNLDNQNAETSRFPSLSGKSSIRTTGEIFALEYWTLQVSIPFREELHSDATRPTFDRVAFSRRFHPFQGRAPFGLEPEDTEIKEVVDGFPSLSGKSSIRTLPGRPLTG